MFSTGMYGESRVESSRLKAVRSFTGLALAPLAIAIEEETRKQL